MTSHTGVSLTLVNLQPARPAGLMVVCGWGAGRLQAASQGSQAVLPCPVLSPQAAPACLALSPLLGPLCATC